MANEGKESPRGSTHQIVHDTAVELAKRKINFKEDDKQNQEKLTLLQSQISLEEEGVNETVIGIYNTIQRQVGNALLPDSLMTECAGYVYNQVKQRGLTSHQEVTVGETGYQKVLKNALQNKDREIENTVQMQSNNESLGKNLEEILKIRENLIKENKDIREKCAPKIFENAHRPDSTKSEDADAGRVLVSPTVDALLKLGIPFDKLTSSDQSFVAAWIQESMNSDNPELKKMAQNYLKGFNISQEKLKKLANTEFASGTVNSQMGEEELKIKGISSKVETLMKYGNIMTLKKRNSYINEIQEDPNFLKYGIDALLEGLTCSEAAINLENKGQRELCDILINLFNNSRAELRVDGYATAYIADIINQILPQDKKIANRLIDLFNDRIPEGEGKLTTEIAKLLQDSKFEDKDLLNGGITDLVSKTIEKDMTNLYRQGKISREEIDAIAAQFSQYSEKSDLSQILSTICKAKEEVVYSENEKKQESQLEHRSEEHPILQNAVVTLVNVNEHAKGKVKENIQEKITPALEQEERSQSKDETTSVSEQEEKNGNRMLNNMINILSSNAPDRAKNSMQKTFLERLSKDKDLQELNTPEALEHKKQLFEIVIARDMNSGKPIDMELMSQLGEIDANALKEVLTDVLLPAYNDAPSMQLSQYIQAISAQVKEQNDKTHEGEAISVESQSKGKTSKMFDPKTAPLGKFAPSSDALVHNGKLSQVQNGRNTKQEPKTKEKEDDDRSF